MNIIDRVLNLIFPKKCLVCGRIENSLICNDCHEKAFAYYGESLELDIHNYLALFYYNDQMKKLLEELKYNKNINLLEIFSRQIIRHAPKPQNIDYIIPVPINPMRYKQRGFNQTTELIKNYANYYAIPVREDIVFRKINTKKMHLLDKAQRAAEVSDVFAVWDHKKDQIKDKNILIFDDIITTGNTIKNVIECLKSCKCGYIYTVGMSRPEINRPR